ncbi:MAG: putative beta-lysine N-acetyltransferase [Actinobacteria bacterium]|nr:putative beta-lysine N-acetyltransferase [Actinomycetota bacterium]
MSEIVVPTSALPVPAGVDRVEHVGGAVVQHGRLSDRVYLLKPGESAEDDLALMERLARRHGYSKLFAKISEERQDAFLGAGYEIEARIPGAAGGPDLLFCSRFLDPGRKRERFTDQSLKVIRAAILESASARDGDTSKSRADDGILLQAADGSDAGELAALYGSVFATYPFPIGDAEFIRQTMSSGTAYFLARDAANEQVIAAASAEMLRSLAACEMTDFATLPERRGLGIAGLLLQALEREVIDTGVRMAFTIARSTSLGMNVVFARQGYTYAGTLVNNTNIAGRIESMNVWYRALA